MKRTVTVLAMCQGAYTIMKGSIMITVRNTNKGRGRNVEGKNYVGHKFVH